MPNGFADGTAAKAIVRSKRELKQLIEDAQASLERLNGNNTHGAVTYWNGYINALKGLPE